MLILLVYLSIDIILLDIGITMILQLYIYKIIQTFGDSSKLLTEEDDLDSAIKTDFMDWPSSQRIQYDFSQNPPKITGQIGIPVIVDSILGIISN